MKEERKARIDANRQRKKDYLISKEKNRMEQLHKQSLNLLELGKNNSDCAMKYQRQIKNQIYKRMWYRRTRIKKLERIVLKGRGRKVLKGNVLSAQKLYAKYDDNKKVKCSLALLDRAYCFYALQCNLVKLIMREIQNQNFELSLFNNTASEKDYTRTKFFSKSRKSRRCDEDL